MRNDNPLEPQTNVQGALYYELKFLRRTSPHGKISFWLSFSQRSQLHLHSLMGTRPQKSARAYRHGSVHQIVQRLVPLAHCLENITTSLLQNSF